MTASWYTPAPGTTAHHVRSVVRFLTASAVCLAIYGAHGIIPA